MFYSLLERKIEFNLFILCLDSKSEKILKSLHYNQITLITLEDIEFYFPDLLSAKKNRNKVEYFWTLSPHLPLYILKKNPELLSITYLDADLYFYNTPEYLFKDLAQKSVLIIPHRLKGEDKKSEESWGKYNVGCLIFKNDHSSMKILDWWKNKCIEWCYYKVEKNRAGDQKYLDNFENISNNVYPSKLNGAGIGDWNIHYYDYHKVKDSILIKDSDEPVIFCHFNKIFILNKTGWILHKSSGFNRMKLLIQPYADSILRAIKEVQSIEHNFDNGIDKINFSIILHGVLKLKIFKGK